MRALGPSTRVVRLLLGLLVAFPSGALEVRVARLAIVDETESRREKAGRPGADLLRELRREAVADSLSFREAETEEIPASLLEASALCERLGYSCLLYGYVKRTEASLSAELKLLDHDGGELAAAFFGSDDPAHGERLMRDMAAKVREYFLTEMGLPPAGPVTRRNRLELSGWLGYWTPLGGDWNRVMTGIGAVGFAARLIPSDRLFTLGPRRGWLAAGLEAEYGLGMNEPDYESFFLHAIKLRLALEAALDLSAGHAAGLGIGLLAELDTAAQDRKYASLFTGTTLAPGFSLSALYRYQLSERLALGVTALLELAAYSPALVTFSPRLFVAFRKGDSHGTPRP